MDAKDIEALASAIVKKQNEAAEAKAAEAAKVAAAQAKEDAKKAEADAAKAVEADKAAAKAAAKQAADNAEAERVAAERQAHIDAVLFAAVGSVFVDTDGAEHRVVGTVGNGVDTVSRDRDGGVVGNWRVGGINQVISTWRRKK